VIRQLEGSASNPRVGTQGGAESPYVTGCRPPTAQLPEGDRGGVPSRRGFRGLFPIEALSDPHAFRGGGGDADEL